MLNRRALIAMLPLTAQSTRRRVLILCTGNSCRSQMAEGILRSFDARLEVFSAGTEPAAQVHPLALRVMREIGLDISGQRPKRVSQFLDQSFDYVVTVCGDADQNCPNFRGKVARRLHIGFPDPAKATGTQAEVLHVFRTVRDDIRRRFREFYEKEVRKS